MKRNVDNRSSYVRLSLDWVRFECDREMTSLSMVSGRKISITGAFYLGAWWVHTSTCKTILGPPPSCVHSLFPV